MHTLDPLTMKLGGLNLIEASAGTGKTHTLTTLYLRLLLERGLDPASILVVTFTDAATGALRERVRHRVSQALASLEGHSGETETNRDPGLVKLLAAVPDRAIAKAILAEAIARMDEAAIYTIHSFCQRMLQDHAFESGAAFEAQLITNEMPLRQHAARDVWRCRVAGASLADAAWIRSHWLDPDALLKNIGSTIVADDLRLLPPLDPQAISREVKLCLELLGQIRSKWQQSRDECLDLLIDNPSLNKKSYGRITMEKLAREMDRFAGDYHLPKQLPEYFKRFQSNTLATNVLKGKTPPKHQFFNLCDHFDEQRMTRANQLWWAWWFTESRSQIQLALAQAKVDKELLSFDDLLKHLDLALAPNHTIGGSAVLAAAIRKRFPVALIDEFQDTDPKQYRIFRQIYWDHPESSLFLIGDPKQAIYSFRGADVFTYMQAKADASRSEAEYTLGINWRSSSKLVKAVNTLFSNTQTPFVYADIPFQAVAPSPGADRQPLRVDGKEPIPLQFWLIPPTPDNTTKKTCYILKAPEAAAAAAQACAEYIAALLQAADTGRAKLGSDPVRSRDIAVLVRKHQEGAQMQRALRLRNVRSVVLSQGSIFATEQAEALAILLTAIARPSDEGLVRAALATVLLGWNAQQINALSVNTIGWTDALDRLQQYHHLWLGKGFIVAWQSLLQQEQIPQRLLQRPDGERWLTNLLQLAELLQAATMATVGIEGLLRWFAAQRAIDEDQRKGKGDDAQQMRLESDEGLVQIVTIHKSKGLEYPIVFIPFPWSLKPHKSDLVIFHNNEDLIQYLDLGTEAQETHKDLQHTEALAEDVRLFYVALTRAARLCVLCWGRVNMAEASAPAFLLHPQPSETKPLSRLGQLDTAELRAELEAIAVRAPGCIEIRELPTPSDIRWSGSQVDLHALKALTFTGAIDSSWSVASYSGLTQGEVLQRPDYAAAVPLDPIFAFPAGKTPGLFLHAILERLDFTRATAENIQLTIQGLYSKYSDLVQDWGTVAAELVNNCLDTPLVTTADGEPLRLRAITLDNRLNELKFHYPLATLTSQTLQTALATFSAYQDIAKGLEFAPRQGLMHGIIDLVFRHGGRYYLVDYKSNLLGMDLTAYAQVGMHKAMHQHHYDLQYLIYTVAVHRFLGQRLPGYSYEQHFGGVYYLFLRGMRPACGASYGVYCDRPPFQVIEALDDLFGGG